MERLEESGDYTGKEQLICLSDKVTLLDSQNFEVLNEIQSEDLEISFYDFWDCEVYAEENGYIVIGTVCDEQDAITRVTMVEDVFVLDFAFIESSNQILFMGNDSNSKRVRGALVLGEKASVAEIYESNLWGKIWLYGADALIEEADVYGKEKAGQFFCYNEQDGIRQYSLTGKEESGFLFLSCEGDYYATKTSVQNEGYLLRICSSEDGRLVRGYFMTYEEYGEKFRLKNILICENTNKIILMVKGLQDQEGTWLMAIDL